MTGKWEEISEDEILDYSGSGTGINERYGRIMQKKSIDSVNSLIDKITGLGETIYRASQGMQNKYDSYSISQTKQQRIVFALTVAILLSTFTYTWITWQSVSAIREANEIQRQILSIQLNKQPASKTDNKPVR